LKEPLDCASAAILVKRILASGTVSYSRHADEQMAERDLTMADCVSVLRGGWCRESQEENGTWRYCMTTQRMQVVVAFVSEDEIVIVTAWRL